MGQPTDHPKTINLDFCWVCNARFVGQGGTETRHDHHMVPRAYGGNDGPTVTVCTKHHTKLHVIAVCIKAKKPYFEQLKGEPQEIIKKLMYLATIVVDAEMATRNDPNKQAQVNITLNRKHKIMIDRLKTGTNCKSREAVLLYALEALYHKTFPQ